MNFLLFTASIAETKTSGLTLGRAGCLKSSSGGCQLIFVELEGLVPNAPNAVISIRYRLANYLCNEYVTNNFHHFQRLSCRHPDRLVSLCEVTKIYVRLQVRGFDLENNNTEC